MLISSRAFKRVFTIYSQKSASVQPRSSFSKFANNEPQLDKKVRTNVGRSAQRSRNVRRSRRENAKWTSSQTRSWHLVRGGSFFQRFARGAGVVRGTFGLLKEKGETEEETRGKQKKKQATCLLKCWVLSGAKVHESCRSPKVLQNV